LGRKGHESKRGCGEIDDEPRTVPLYIKITEFDSQLIEIVMKLEQKSKAQVVIESIRQSLGKYAGYTASEGSDTSKKISRDN